MALPGPDPELITVQSPEGIPKALGAVLRRVIDDGGISPANVVVIAQRKETIERLGGTTLGHIRLVKPVETATAPSAPPATGESPGRSVVIETIHRFKGLEADVVIVILSRLEGGPTARSPTSAPAVPAPIWSSSHHLRCTPELSGERQRPRLGRAAEGIACRAEQESVTGALYGLAGGREEK